MCIILLIIVVIFGLKGKSSFRHFPWVYCGYVHTLCFHKFGMASRTYNARRCTRVVGSATGGKQCRQKTFIQYDEI